jgi:hypothetical protein
MKIYRLIIEAEGGIEPPVPSESRSTPFTTIKNPPYLTTKRKK